APDRNELCLDCFDELVTTCAECLDDIMQEDAVIVDGDAYCDDCAHRRGTGCTCHLRREQARAEAEAASDPFRDHYVADDGGSDGYTVAERENQERIEAAVAAVDTCDRCREQEGQITLPLAWGL